MSHVDATAVLLIIMGATSATPNLFTLESQELSVGRKDIKERVESANPDSSAVIQSIFTHEDCLNQASATESGRE